MKLIKSSRVVCKHKIIKVFLCLLLFASYTSVKAQQPQIYNQFFMNPYTYNPAYAGVEGHAAIFTMYRDQWTNIEEAPQLTNVSFHVPLQGGIALGGSAYNITQGLLTTSAAKFTGSYLINIDRTHFLRFGMSLGAGFNTVNINELADAGLNDPAISGFIDQSTFFIGDFGAAYHFGHFNVGVAIPNLFGYNPITQREVAEVTFSPTNNLLFKMNYRGHVSDNFAFEPHIIYRYSEVVPDQFEGVLIGHLYHVVWVGAAYRQDAGIIALAGAKIQEKYAIGLSYELGNANIASELGPTFEINIGFHLGTKKDHAEHVSSFIKSHRLTAEERARKAELERQKQLSELQDSRSPENDDGFSDSGDLNDSNEAFSDEGTPANTSGNAGVATSGAGNAAGIAGTAGNGNVGGTNTGNITGDTNLGNTNDLNNTSGGFNSSNSNPEGNSLGTSTAGNTGSGSNNGFDNTGDPASSNFSNTNTSSSNGNSNGVSSGTGNFTGGNPGNPNGINPTGAIGVAGTVGNTGSGSNNGFDNTGDPASSNFGNSNASGSTGNSNGVSSDTGNFTGGNPGNPNGINPTGAIGVAGTVGNTSTGNSNERNENGYSPTNSGEQANDDVVRPTILAGERAKADFPTKRADGWSFQENQEVLTRTNQFGEEEVGLRLEKPGADTKNVVISWIPKEDVDVMTVAKKGHLERIIPEEVTEVGIKYEKQNVDGSVENIIKWDRAIDDAQANAISSNPTLTQEYHEEVAKGNPTLTQDFRTPEELSGSDDYLVTRRGNHLLELPVGNYVISGAFNEFQNAENHSDRLFIQGYKDTKVGFSTARGYYYVVVYESGNLNQTRSRRDDFRKLPELSKAWVLQVTD